MPIHIGVTSVAAAAAAAAAADHGLFLFRCGQLGEGRAATVREPRDEYFLDAIIHACVAVCLTDCRRL